MFFWEVTENANQYVSENLISIKLILLFKFICKVFTGYILSTFTFNMKSLSFFRSGHSPKLALKS